MMDELDDLLELFEEACPGAEITRLTRAMQAAHRQENPAAVMAYSARIESLLRQRPVPAWGVAIHETLARRAAR